MGTFIRHTIAGFSVLALVVACGDDDNESESSAATDLVEVTDTASEDGDDGSNACPADGCAIEIVDVATNGEELQITWAPNFAPDIDRNHIHVYWDTYSADQVSGDAADRGVEQGFWMPIDEPTTYVTDGDVSVATRGDSTALCVTAADGDHNVIDSSIVDCWDVAELS